MKSNRFNPLGRELGRTRLQLTLLRRCQLAVSPNQRRDEFSFTAFEVAWGKGKNPNAKPCQRRREQIALPTIRDKCKVARFLYLKIRSGRQEKLLKGVGAHA